MPNTIYTYQSIDPAECIGDSVYKINNNNNFAANAIGDLETRIATLSAALNAANLALTLAVSAAAPVGAVQTFAMSTPPTGWLECNGVTIPASGPDIQGVSVTLLQTLRNRVGTTYGVLGKLPDLRGEFVRGWDNSRGIDTGRTFGSNQADEFKSHSHTSTFIRDRAPTTAGNAVLGDENYYGTQDVSTNAVGGTETRPRNIALLYCIKY